MAELFAPRRAGAGLKRTAIRGVATTFAGQGGTFLLGFVSTAVLARVLTPEDFGLVAMTTVVTGFITLFSEAGLGSATLQRERITHEQISTLLWVNVALGCVLAGVVAAISPLVAAFFSEPRLVGITCGLAVAFAFSGFSVQHRALLRRQLRFRAVVTVNLCALACGIVVAMVMAWRGFGYWSLVALSVTQSAADAAGLWMVLPWRPGRPRRGVGTGSMLRFGGDVLSFNVMNYLARQSDTLLIGWRWGPVALSFYDKAYRMLLLPLRQLNRPVSAVLVPALSRLQSDPPRFARFFLRAFELLTGVSVPLVTGIAVFADEVVLLWLGPQWSPTAQLFRLLAVAAVIGVMYNPIGWLLVASGQTRRYRWIGVILSVTCISAFLIGLPYGAAGVSIAYSIAISAIMLPVWIYALRGSPVRLSGVLRAAAAPLGASLLSAAAAYAVLHADLLNLPQVPRTVLAAVVFCAVYGLVLLVGLRRWRLYWGVLRDLRAGRGGPQR